MNDWTQWQRVLSPASVKVWNHLNRWPDKDLHLRDLTYALRLSKTAVRAALTELVKHGFLAVYEDVGDADEGS